MGYEEEKKRLVYLLTDGENIIQRKHCPDNLHQYRQVLQSFESGRSLEIRFPGYKTTPKKCDYCVYLTDGCREWPVAHREIMLDLYEKTTLRNYESMKHYVETVASEGMGIDVFPDAFGGELSFGELTALMFYIAIQEDINYPETYYQGRKMCFFRYLEAIYCKIGKNHSLEEAVERAEARGKIPSFWQGVGDLYQGVAAIKR